MHSPALHILCIHVEISSLFSSHTFSSWIGSTTLLPSSSCQIPLLTHACLMLTYMCGYCLLSMHLGYFCSIVFFFLGKKIITDIYRKCKERCYFWIYALMWMYLLEGTMQLNPTKWFGASWLSTFAVWLQVF